MCAIVKIISPDQVFLSADVLSNSPRKVQGQRFARRARWYTALWLAARPSGAPLWYRMRAEMDPVLARDAVKRFGFRRDGEACLFSGGLLFMDTERLEGGWIRSVWDTVVSEGASDACFSWIWYRDMTRSRHFPR